VIETAYTHRAERSTGRSSASVNPRSRRSRRLVRACSDSRLSRT